eukprot:GILJ01013588.1.p1 GENE.GILJ01013588.1~~GILJ01013588.1.p1  ORF type:complete len:400 (+),score=59.28 GILJ01013588.1:311-1510(+)
MDLPQGGSVRLKTYIFGSSGVLQYGTVRHAIARNSFKFDISCDSYVFQNQGADGVSIDFLVRDKDLGSNTAVPNGDCGCVSVNKMAMKAPQWFSFVPVEGNTYTTPTTMETEPTNTTELPTDDTTTAETGGNQSSISGETDAPLTSESGTTDDVPPVTTAFPGTTGVPPATTPGATTVPPPTTGIPPATTGVPATTVAPPVTTAAPPGTTAAPPVTTAAPPVTTAAPPVTTAAPPVTTAAPPVTTAAPPATTAVPPATTAAPPATTAVPPAATTLAPATTAAPPVATASPSLPLVAANGRRLLQFDDPTTKGPAAYISGRFDPSETVMWGTTSVSLRSVSGQQSLSFSFTGPFTAFHYDPFVAAPVYDMTHVTNSVGVRGSLQFVGLVLGLVLMIFLGE